MQDEIDEFFEDLSVYDDANLTVLYAADSVASQVESFAEVMIEWYLFDSSTEKNIKTFLETEELGDVFTESEFMDLMCGKAYLDDELVNFVQIKLPFRITLERLGVLNAKTKMKNPAAYVVKKSGITDKIHALLQLSAEETRVKRREKQREYRKAHREQINCKKREYWAKHSEKYNLERRIYYQEHKQEFAETVKKYRKTHPEKVKELKRKYWAVHREELNLKRRIKYWLHHQEERERCRKYRQTHPEIDKKYYQQNRERHLAQGKVRYQEHKEEILLKRKQRYNANKEKFAVENKARYEKRKKRAQDAKKVCAVYLFLLQLRKENNEQYLKLYNKQQDPIASMIKTCVALQNMDFGVCPLAKCDGDIATAADKCGCPNVFAVPGANNVITKILEDLRENTK